MSKRDYYEVLGVGRQTSAEDIKKAYRRLAREYHPDVNKDPRAAERFKEISEAYDVLSDPEKRSRYDQRGHAGLGGGFDPGAGGEGPFGGFGGFGFGGLDDIFETFFGGAAGGKTQRQRAQRGADLRLDLEISLAEAAFGGEKEIAVTKEEACDQCRGSGAAPGSGVTTCPTCGGTGQVRSARGTVFGQFVTVHACNRCGGEGRVVEKPCAECHGEGRVGRRKTIKVRIPPGVDDHTRLRVSGEGAAGRRGAPPGDLFVDIHVKNHPRFVRDGYDIVSEVTVGIAQAALGTVVEVPVLTDHGKKAETEELIVPPGTQSGNVIRLRGRGIPRLNGTGRGDHRVRVKVAVPRNLSEEEKSLLRRLAALRGEIVAPDEKGFFQKVKDALNG